MIFHKGRDRYSLPNKPALDFLPAVLVQDVIYVIFLELPDWWEVCAKTHFCLKALLEDWGNNWLKDMGKKNWDISWQAH